MKLYASALMQLRCIVALTRRRVRSEFRGTRSGYLWALVEPIAMTMFLKLMLQHRDGGLPPVGESYEVFFVTGFTLARCWRQTTSQIAASLSRETPTSLPSLFRLDAVLSVAALEFFTTTAVMIILLTALYIFGFNSVPYDLLGTVFAIGVTVTLALSCGMFLALLEVVAPALSQLRTIIVLPFFITSGFAFLIDRMPPNLAEIIVWNPVVHCIELFREAFYRGYACRRLDELYLLLVIIFGILLGMLGERAFRRKPRRIDTYDDEAAQQEY